MKNNNILEPKYRVGDICYYIDGMELSKGEISSIHIEHDRDEYKNEVVILYRIYLGQGIFDTGIKELPYSSRGLKEEFIFSDLDKATERLDEIMDKRLKDQKKEIEENESKGKRKRKRFNLLSKDK